MSVLVRRGLLVTQDPSRRVLPGNLYVEAERIAEVDGPDRSADVVLDAEGCLVLPGLINAYTTVAHALLGPPDDLPAMARRERLDAFEDHLTRRDLQMAAAWAAAEMLRTGTTSFLDLYRWEEEVARAVVETGGRGFLAWRVNTPEDLDAGDRFLNRVRDWERVVPLLGAADATAVEVVEGVGELARRRGTLHCLPVAETRQAVYRFQKAHGRRPVEWLAAGDLLGEGQILVHAVWLTLNEIRALARSGTGVVHCPLSNQLTGAGGPMPLPEMDLEAVPLALGTDSPYRAGPLDLFQHLRAGGLVHRGHRWDPAVLSSQRLLDLSTVGAAACLDFAGGRLEPGRPADVVVLEPGTRTLPADPADLISYLVYQTDGTQVRDVVVNGQVVVENGELQTLDLASIREEVTDLRRELGH